jgi:plasmid stabilization system protein ParE
MRITILDAAERDLEEGYSFYEKQSSNLGSYFLDSLYSDIDSLTFFAGIHIKKFGYYRLLSKKFPFAIYYNIIGDEVLISAVLDCRRDPIVIKNRLASNI